MGTMGTFRHFWALLGTLGTFGDSGHSGHYGHPRHFFGTFEHFWAFLTPLGTLGGFRVSGHFLVTLGTFDHSRQTVHSGHTVHFWALLGTLGSFGHFGAILSTFGHFWALLNSKWWIIIQSVTSVGIELLGQLKRNIAAGKNLLSSFNWESFGGGNPFVRKCLESLKSVSRTAQSVSKDLELKYILQFGSKKILACLKNNKVT